MNSYRDPEGKRSFAELLAAVGEVPGIRRVRFTTSHPRDFTRDIVEAIDRVPTLCDHVHLPVQSGSARVLERMAREYTPEWYLERIAWIKAARRPISLSTDIIVGFPGETEDDFIADDGPAGRSPVRLRLRIQVLCAAEHAGAAHARYHSQKRRKQRGFKCCLTGSARFKESIIPSISGQILEVMVEGANPARGQIAGRSSQNKPVNFTCTQPIAPAPGSYLPVKITGAYPNSLMGESV